MRAKSERTLTKRLKRQAFSRLDRARIRAKKQAGNRPRGGDMDRRKLLGGASAGILAFAGGAMAQNRPPQAPPQPQPPAAQPAPQPKLSFEDVIRRARELAGLAYEAPPPLPDALSRLDFDAWRDIRVRPERAFLNQGGSAFRLQAFHPGVLYTRPVVINLIREGVAAP
ncbi:MAG: glucan biosynthesis protein, partial [Beijerinckiaceae bacterium]